MKTSTIIWILLALTVVGLVIWQIYRYRHNTKNITDSDSSANGNSAGTYNPLTGGSSSVWGNDSFPLKKYSSGDRVVKLQTALNNVLKPDEKLTVDGKFGDKTEVAVKAMQERLGLAIDGGVTESQYNAGVLNLYSGQPAGTGYLSLVPSDPATYLSIYTFLTAF